MSSYVKKIITMQGEAIALVNERFASQDKTDNKHTPVLIKAFMLMALIDAADLEYKVLSFDTNGEPSEKDHDNIDENRKHRGYLAVKAEDKPQKYEACKNVIMSSRHYANKNTDEKKVEHPNEPVINAPAITENSQQNSKQVEQKVEAPKAVEAKAEEPKVEELKIEGSKFKLNCIFQYSVIYC